MWGTVILNLAAGALKLPEWPLSELHKWLALKAAKRSAAANAEEGGRVVRLEMVLTRDRLGRVLQNPDILTGLGLAQGLREGGQLPLCPTCGFCQA